MQMPKKIPPLGDAANAANRALARRAHGVLSGFRLHVRFKDGTEGTVELADFLNSPSAGVFAALRDKNLFRQARIELGAVVWPDNLDLAPDAMHQEIKEHGSWIVR